jgi:iron complex outermembrane receptor protein
MHSVSARAAFRCRLTLRLGAVLAIAGTPLLAAAQVLEEIVVTAQKREESIQEIGISVTAFTGEDITRLGFENAEEIALLTPGLHYAPLNGGQEAQFTIRGVIQSDFNDFIESPNAVYIDEGYISNTQGQRFGLFDLDRVEVLRGPQGTLFGRNATGGLVHFITRKPTREFEAFGDVQYGSYDQVRFEGAIGGPLSERLSARVSVLYNRHDGFQDNLFGDPALAPLDITDVLLGAPAPGPFVPSTSGAEDIGGEDAWAVRGQLLWEVTPEASLLLSGFASGAQPTSPPFQQIGTTAVLDPNTGQHLDTILARDDPQRCEAISSVDGSCLPIDFNDGDFVGDGNPPDVAFTRPVVGSDLFGFLEPGGFDNLDTAQDFAPDDFTEYDMYGATGKLTWQIGEVTLTAVSHYMHYEKQQALDGDITPVPQVIVMNYNETSSFTQELRLNGDLGWARWVAGFYYLHIDNGNAFGFGQSPDSPLTTLFTAFGSVPGTPFEEVTLVGLETDSYSVFGQIDFDLTDKLTFIAGLRTIFEDKEFDYTQPFFVNNDDARVDDDQPPISSIDLFGFGPLEYPDFTGDSSDTLWAGRLAVEYQPIDDWLLYAGINRGVKAGSFNGKPQDFTDPLPPEDIPYKEEVLTSYEIGFKSTVLDGTTNINGSFYFYDYDDYQAFVFVGVGGFVDNADAKYLGAELEVVSRPVDNFDLLLNASWIDAEISNLGVADGVFRDVEPTLIPDWQVGGLARYTWPALLLGGDVSAQMDFNYVSDRPSNIRNFTSHVLEEYVIGNARLSWTSADDHWTVTAFVNNLSDTQYNVNSFDLSTLCGCTEEPPGKPRWFGGRIRYTWD